MREHVRLKDLPPEVQASFEDGAHVCGCGTCKDLKETALRACISMLRGDDCVGWHLKVLELQMMLLVNMQRARAINEHGHSPALIEQIDKSAEESVHIRNAWTNCFMEKHEEWAGDAIVGPMRAAWNGENWNEGSEKKQ